MVVVDPQRSSVASLVFKLFGCCFIYYYYYIIVQLFVHISVYNKGPKGGKFAYFLNETWLC